MSLEDTTENTTGETIVGEATIPTYSFAGRLEAAINAALGDTAIDNPGHIVATEFCSLLYKRGIGPDVFANLFAETESAYAETPTAPAVAVAAGAPLTN